MIDKAKKTKASNASVKTFIYAVTLLQNAISMEEFERYLVNIYNMFNQINATDSCLKSIAKFRCEISKRNINAILDDPILNEKFHQKVDSDLDENIFVTGDTIDTVDSLKKESPFSIYFNDRLLECEKIVTLCNQSPNGQFPINELYCPELFNIIHEKLYLMPLWTCIITSEWQTQHAGFNFHPRLTNNPVEGDFQKLKNIIFPKMLVLPSQIAEVFNVL